MTFRPGENCPAPPVSFRRGWFIIFFFGRLWCKGGKFVQEADAAAVLGAGEAELETFQAGNKAGLKFITKALSVGEAS